MHILDWSHSLRAGLAEGIHHLCLACGGADEGTHFRRGHLLAYSHGVNYVLEDTRLESRLVCVQLRHKVDDGNVAGIAGRSRADHLDRRIFLGFRSLGFSDSRLGRVLFGLCRLLAFNHGLNDLLFLLCCSKIRHRLHQGQLLLHTVVHICGKHRIVRTVLENELSESREADLAFRIVLELHIVDYAHQLRREYAQIRILRDVVGELLAHSRKLRAHLLGSIFLLEYGRVGNHGLDARDGPQTVSQRNDRHLIGRVIDQDHRIDLRENLLDLGFSVGREGNVSLLGEIE